MEWELVNKSIMYVEERTKGNVREYKLMMMSSDITINLIIFSLFMDYWFEHNLNSTVIVTIQWITLVKNVSISKNNQHNQDIL